MNSLLRLAARPWTFLLLCVLIFGSWVAWAYLVHWHFHDWPTRGQSGDMFGGLNTLFTGLAFAGLAYTIVFQKVQSMDDEVGRKEQRAFLEQQRFESTFFQLLTLLNQIIASIEVGFQRLGGGNVPLSGRDAFIPMSQALEHEYSSVAAEPNPPDGANSEQMRRIQVAYEKFYKKHDTRLGHYYRTLYHLIKYIDTSSMANKDFYAHLVRAQLSDPQVFLLFYNCLADVGKSFKPLAEKYALLKHMQPSVLLDERHVALFLPAAYANIAKSNPTKS